MRSLVIGDIHNPVAHPGYLAFCQDLRARYRCDDVVFIGDVVDWHAISFHTKHPDAPGPKDEYELAKLHIGNWYRAFPKAKVCVGNHDARVVRLAAESNIPAELIKDFAEAWETPGWTWANSFTQDDVHYFHGTGTSGIHPAFNSMLKMCLSVVQGHIHSAAGIKWRANPMKRFFGMDTGCGIDDRAYAFAYGKDQKMRSILSAGVVIDGIPHHEVMAIGPGEKYHRSRFNGENADEKKVLVLTGGEFVSRAGDLVHRRMSEQGNPRSHQAVAGAVPAGEGEGGKRRQARGGQGDGRRQGERRPGKGRPDRAPVSRGKRDRKRGA